MADTKKHVYHADKTKSAQTGKKTVYRAASAPAVKAASPPKREAERPKAPAAKPVSPTPQKTQAAQPSHANVVRPGNATRTIRRSERTITAPRRPAPAAPQPAKRVSAKRTKKKTKALAKNLVFAVLICVFSVGVLGWALNRKPEVTVSKDASGEWPVQVGDRLVDARPQRLISLSPMLTQAILSLPGNESLCGVTEYCSTGSREIATVGTPLLPRADRIAELNADYILCQTPLPEAAAKSLEQNGARIIQLASPQSLSELREMYRQLGAILLGQKTGAPIGAAVIDRMTDTLDRCKAITGGQKTALLVPDLSGFAATADTPEWSILGRIFQHPLPQDTNWLASREELADEDAANDLDAVRAADPDVLFIPADVSPEELTAALGGMRAVQTGCVVYYERSHAENLSPRLVLDAVKGAELAAPELFQETKESLKNENKNS